METDDNPRKQPIYYEVVFSKRGSALNEYWRVYIELKDTDADLLSPLMNAKLKTLRIVRRAEVLELLPKGLDDNWPLHGRTIDDGIDGWIEGTIPVTGHGDHTIWIIPANGADLM